MMTSPSIPMPKLTDEQQEFAQWLLQGNSLFLCSEICSDFGKVDDIETFNGHFQKRTLFRLNVKGYSQKAQYLRWAFVGKSSRLTTEVSNY